MVVCVFCEIEHCKHWRRGGCGKGIISIEQKTTGEFQGGRRISYPICKNYEEILDDGN